VAHPTQLILYNGALRLLGQPKLATITEEKEARRILDDAWNDEARDFVLEQGNWNFATRTIRIEIDSALTPEFGFNNAFNKPDDWVRTVTIASDEYFLFSMTDREYNDEGDYWFSDIDQMYVKHVSNDAAYGADYALWPRTYLRLNQAYLAREINPRLKQTTKSKEDAEEVYDKALTLARSNDALNEGVKFAPPGGWGTARGGRGGRRDRGGRNSLTG